MRAPERSYARHPPLLVTRFNASGARACVQGDGSKRQARPITIIVRPGLGAMQAGGRGCQEVNIRGSGRSHILRFSRSGIVVRARGSAYEVIRAQTEVGKVLYGA